MPNIFVSILNFNGEKDTLECLNSLEHINTAGFNLSVVVVDNASQKPFNTDKDLYKNFKLSIINSSVNLGFSGGQNLGIKYAFKNSADYVVILNNDVVLDNNFLQELFKTFQEQSDCGLVSPKIYFAKGHEFHKARYKEKELGKVIWYAGGKMDWENILGFHIGVDDVDTGRYEKLEKTDFATGCCVMIKKDVFASVGFFDEKYFLYYEDNDISKRAKNKGFEIYFQPKSLIWHLNAGSTGGSGSSLHDYYISRNRLLFGFKYASFKTKLALFKESIKIAAIGRRWQKKGVLDFYLKNFGKGSYK